MLIHIPLIAKRLSETQRFSIRIQDIVVSLVGASCARDAD